MHRTIALFFTSLLLTTPAHAEWTYDAERCALEVADLDAAYRHCTIAIDSGRLDDVELSRTYANRSSILGDLGRVEEAEQDASTAIDLNPGSPFAWSNRGSMRGRLGKYDAAITDFEKTLQLADGAGADFRETVGSGDPENPSVGLGAVFDASIGLAIIYSIRGEREKGMPHAKRAHEIAPDRRRQFQLYEWYGLI